MNVQAELSNAVKKRYTDVYGAERSPKTTEEAAKQNGKKIRRQEPAVSKANQASRSAAKKAAAAALMRKMGGRQPPSSSATAADKKKKGWKIPFSTPKGSPVTSVTAAGGGPLNKTEEETAQRYRKIMKMGLPEGAVRHKMISDGVSERIVEAVISGKNSSHSQTPILQKQSVNTSGGRSSLSLGEEKIAEKYRKMVKIGMPKGAVLHKMIADGVSAKIQDAVMAGESSSAIRTSSATSSSTGRKKNDTYPAADPGNATRSIRSSLSLEEEKIAVQYRTMVKIKMPEGAIRHKMIADEVSAKIQDSVFGRDIPEMSSSSSPQPPPPSSSSRGGKARGNFSSLSREDEIVATPYRKMMKMGMPEGAVKHKMTVDGISASIQNSVLRDEIPNEDPLGGAGGSTASHMRPPANPMAAAIASSGGIGSLKKASVKENKTAAAAIPSNPLAAAIAASRGQSGLKKTFTTDNNLQPLKPKSCNSLVDELSSIGFRSALKKTLQKSPEQPPKLSSGNALTDELSSIDFRSALKKTPLKSPDQLPDVSTSDSLTNELSFSGLQSQEEPPKRSTDDDDSSRHLSGIKVKSKRLQEESPESSTSVANEDDSPRRFISEIKGKPTKLPDDDSSRRFQSGIKVKSTRSPEESPEISTNIINEDSARRFQAGIKVKSMRSPEESPERSTNVTNGDSTRRFQSGIKVKSIRSLEGQSKSSTSIGSEKSEIKVKSIRLLEEQSKSSSSTGSGNNNSSGSLQSAAKIQEEQPRSNFTNGHTTRRFQSGIKVKSIRLQEEQPKRSNSIGSGNNNSSRSLQSATKIQEEQSRTNSTNEHTTRRFQSGIRVKSVRLQQEEPKSSTSTSIGSGRKNSSRSLQSATKIQEKQPRSSANIRFGEDATMDTSLGNEVNQNSRNQSTKTADDSQKSRTPNSKMVKNSDKNKKANTLTTDDGVDHHCQCIVM